LARPFQAARPVPPPPDDKAPVGPAVPGAPGVRELATLQAHDTDMAGLAISPDGRTLATATGFPEWVREGVGEVKLWDLGPRKWTARFAGRGPVAFTPDSRSLFFFRNRDADELLDALRGGDPDPRGAYLSRRDVATQKLLPGLLRVGTLGDTLGAFAFSP